jgi:hypothetical protein
MWGKKDSKGYPSTMRAGQTLQMGGKEKERLAGTR